MKDNFSTQSNLYAQFRPSYPESVFTFLNSVVKHHDVALDVATGNGQCASALAKYFKQVCATDISHKQIENAIQKENIIYKIETAEETSFANHQFDLITVAQAIHWFDFDLFYSEVKRLLKPDGVIAIIGYPLMTVNETIDKIILHFYNDIIGSFWDPERKYIDEEYKTIPFPFKEIQSPTLSVSYQWRFEQLIGFLNTWSAVQHYIKKNKQNPVKLIQDELNKHWKENETLQVTFPILLRVGIN